MFVPSKRVVLLLQAIVAIVTTLSLGSFAARAASQTSAAQHMSWGQLKARYRPNGGEQAESVKGGATASGKVKVAQLASLKLSPSSVVGGSGSQGTLQLTSAAPVGGALVALSNSNPALVSTPASVTIPAGSKTATFSITTKVPAADGSAIVSATYSGIVRTATLTVTALATPPPPAAAALSSVTLAPASVLAGNSSQGTLKLTAAAPVGGALVTLSSADAALVGVPASINIAEGASSATFALSSTPSVVGGNVVITATYLGVSRTATLAVAPSDPCASLTGLGGAAVISLASVPQFRTGRLRIDLVGDVPAGWINAIGACATGGAPTVSFESGSCDATLAGTNTSVTGAGGPLTFGPLLVPVAVPEPGVVLATDAAGNVLQIIWPALAGLPAGPPVMRMNLVSWTAAVQAGVALDATMTFNARNVDGSTATFTAHGTNMVVPAFRP